MTDNPRGQAFNKTSGQWNLLPKIPRPGYEWVSATKVQIVASTTKVRYFLIGKTLYSSTSNMVCDFGSSGAGGLDNGSIASNVPYYLYGVISNGVQLVASLNDPDTGPAGFGEWTYIGAAPTPAASAEMDPFQAVSGFFISDDEIENETYDTNTSYTALTYASMPVTARQLFVTVSLFGDSLAGTVGYVSGTGRESFSDSIEVRGQIDGQQMSVQGYVPVITSKVVYARITDVTGTNSITVEMKGFREDPTEYP